MEWKDLIFDKQCINKNEFRKNKKPVSIDKVEIRRIVLSKKDSYDKKGSFIYFIEFINETNTFPVNLPQMNRYVKIVDSNNKSMNLLIQDKDLLKNATKYGIRLIIYWKKGLVVKQCTIMTTLKLRYTLIIIE